MEGFLIVLSWILLGFFSAYKFALLPAETNDDKWGVFFCLIGGPIAAFIGFIKAMLIDKWVE